MSAQNGEEDPSVLPIRRYADSITSAVRDNPTVVVIGETGSGKTTQISQILHEAGFANDGQIAITQPRRVAAVTVAKRVADEMQVELGSTVGYAVRFEDCSSPDTKMKYLTDGTLLRECLEDKELSKYSVIVLDEAHERSLNTDILFGVLKQLVAKRSKPLKLVITSATLDGEKFSIYYNGCPVFNVPGRCYPVDIIHSMQDHQRDYIDAAVDVVLQVHTMQPPGDILVFLTGQAEVDKAIAQLNKAISTLSEDECGPLMLLPLYAALPPEMQVRVFRPAPEGVRRCIVATNVAETSITVAGVVYVVDSGMVKQKHHHASSGMDSLDVVPVSRVAATQRAGRAGRTQAGKCFRLYTRNFFDRQMPDVSTPEIQRTSLAGAVLYLKTLTLDVDVLAFDFVDKPAREALEDALRTLYVLDALDADGNVTKRGHEMAALPLEPALARCLLAAEDAGCLPEMISVAAMLSTERIFVQGQNPGDVTSRSEGRQGAPSGGTMAEQQQRQRASARLKELVDEGLGDHILLLRLWEGWQDAAFSRDYCKDYGLDLRGMNFAKDIRKQLEGVMISQQQSRRSAHSTADPSGRQPSDKSEPGHKRSRSEGSDRSGVDGEAENGPSKASEPPSKRSRDREREGDRSGQRRSEGRAAREKEKGAQGLGMKRSVFPSDAHRISAVILAITVGFAHKLARRLPRHNGYRTLGTGAAVGGGQLAQPHPACSALAEDEDGLLPEWIVYHELVATTKPFLRQVCSTRYEFVEGLLPKIANVDVRRLSRGGPPESKPAQAEPGTDAGKASAAAAANALPVRRNDSSSVNAAKERYLQRKQQQGTAGRR